jgi:hypothetical protein
METITLSQLLPALMLRRSAVNSGLRPTVNAKPATKESPSRTHAFDQFGRPADAKRHIAVITRLKQSGIRGFRIASCIAWGAILTFQTIFSVKILFEINREGVD